MKAPLWATLVIALLPVSAGAQPGTAVGDVWTIQVNWVFPNPGNVRDSSAAVRFNKATGATFGCSAQYEDSVDPPRIDTVVCSHKKPSPGLDPTKGPYARSSLPHTDTGTNATTTTHVPTGVWYINAQTGYTVFCYEGLRIQVCKPASIASD